MKEVYGLPEGSYFIINDSANIDDATWILVVKELAAKIQKLSIARDHPDWWMLLTHGGFKLHVNVMEVLEIFHKYKIRMAKEEAGTLHVNQAYDQGQAKADKRETRQLLELVRTKIKVI